MSEYNCLAHKLHFVTAVWLVAIRTAINVYPEHWYLNYHPCTLSEFSLIRPNQVDLHKYTFHCDSQQLMIRMVFAPCADKYVYQPSRPPFATKEGMLVTPGLGLDCGNKNDAIEAHLNASARVIVLIAVQEALSSVLNVTPILTGAPSSLHPFSL